MSRKHRKIYKQGKTDGYALGYAQGLHDGNPFIKMAEAIADVVNRISDSLNNPEVLKALEEAKKIQEEEGSVE